MKKASRRDESSDEEDSAFKSKKRTRTGRDSHSSAEDSDEDSQKKRKRKSVKSENASESATESEDEDRNEKRRSKLKSFTKKASSKKSVKRRRSPSFDLNDYSSGGAFVYRAIRQERVVLGWSQAPCGRCPVFDFCSDKGRTNPRECVHYEEWFSLGTTSQKDAAPPAVKVEI